MMRIQAPYGDTVTYPCGHHTPYGGQFANDIGKTGDPYGDWIYFNGYGSPDGLMGYVTDAGYACAYPSPYAGRVAKVDVYEFVASWNQWFNTGTIWYAHVENIQTGWKGIGQPLATVSNGTESGCWSAPHVHVEWHGNSVFFPPDCIGIFPDLGDI